MQKSLVKNTSIYMSVSLLSQGLLFLVWVILPWMLPAEQIGLYSMVFFFIEFMATLSIFGMDAAVTKYYHSKYDIQAVLNSALFLVCLSAVLCLTIYACFRVVIATVFTKFPVIVTDEWGLISVIVVSYTLANFFLTHYTAIRSPSQYSLLLVSRTGIYGALLLALVYFNYSLKGILYALAVSSSVVCVTFLMREKSQISLNSISVPLIKEMVSYSYPLMLYSSISIVIIYFSRLVMPWYVNLEKLGVYNFYLNLIMQIIGIWGSFNRAWTPEVFSKINLDKAAVMNNILIMAQLSVVMYLFGAIFILFFGKLFIFSHILKTVYLENINILYILSIGPVFVGIYTVLYPLFYYEKRTKLIMLISLTIAIINVVASIFMIKAMGQTGAALCFSLIAIITPWLYLAVFNKHIDISPTIFVFLSKVTLLMGANLINLVTLKSESLFMFFNIVCIYLCCKGINILEHMVLLSNRIKQLLNRLARAA